jgi:hypothetical protein
MHCVRILAAGLLLISVGCFNRLTVKPEPGPEQKVVEKFLKEMVDGDEDGMKKFISPEWLEDNDIDIDDYQVNAYSPTSFTVTKVKGSKVTVKILFSGGSTHKLMFKVSEEDDKYYIVPGSYDEDEWIHPWQEAETDIDK